MEQHNLSLGDLKDVRGIQKAKKPGQSFNLVYRKNDDSFEIKPVLPTRPPRQIMYSYIPIKYVFDQKTSVVGKDRVEHIFKSGYYRLFYALKGDSRKLSGYNMKIKFYKDAEVILTVSLGDILNNEYGVVIKTNTLISLDRESNVCEIVITGTTGLFVECWLSLFIKPLDMNNIEDLYIYLR